MATNEQLTWEQRLQYPTRTVTFDTHPDVKEYIVSYDEIQELNKVEKNLLLDQAIKVLGGMNKDESLRDEPDEVKQIIMMQERTMNIGFNQALSQAIDKLKELKE